jgi:AraC-like DNA-binding protein
MFYIVGIVISFFLTLLLVGKKKKSQGDQILTAWLAVLCVHFTLFYLFTSGEFIHFPHLLGIEIPFPLLYGPFLLVYTQMMTRFQRMRIPDWLHFIPAMVTYAWLSSFFLLPGEKKIYVYQHGGEGYDGVMDVIRAAIIVSGITYILITLLMLRRHRRTIQDEFSNTDKINLNWLRYLSYGTSAIWIAIISGLDDRYIYSTAVVYVFFLGYFGIRQAGIFSNQRTSDIHSSPPSPTDPLLAPPDAAWASVSSGAEVVSAEKNEQVANGSGARVKYQKSSLTDEAAAKIHGQLGELMEKEQLFRNPELTLGEVARQLGVHPNILSQVINTFERKSFYDYINGQRIEEFKKVIATPDSRQFTLLALAFECGFNSKTAFNRNFRKSTGLSPSEYLRQAHVSLAH